MTRRYGFILTAAVFPVLCLMACDAGVTSTGGSGQGLGGSGGAGVGGVGTGGTPSEGGAQTTSSTMFAGGGGSGGGSGGEGGGPPINPCGTGCGAEELCTGINKGLDDDCDGTVDEGCACTDGQASSCFEGDSSYLSPEHPGCNAGTMYCTELGGWGPCEGGSHATDLCFNADPLGCHPINVVPFGTIDLTTGPGNFNDDPAIDAHLYEVTCPTGVDPCPVPNGTDYTPLQSGEYTVTYTKTIDGVDTTCSFPLFVGARGLRVELSWNFEQASVDLDLHMKKPMSVLPWVTGGAEQDCGYANCVASDFVFGGSGSPDWFNGVAPPDPVDWFEDPVLEANSCYFAPPPQGATWMSAGMGCHNPRLDSDNVFCDPDITDPTNTDFCTPENINVDYPPKDQWIRIGVHHFSHSSSLPTFPNVKIFCDGALAADLGNAGFYSPTAPITFNASGDASKQWLVADVLFREDECVKECIVEPLYLAPSVDKLPIILTPAQFGNAQSGYGPPYPPIPR